MSDIIIEASNIRPKNLNYEASLETGLSQYFMHLGEPKDVASLHITSRQVSMSVRKRENRNETKPSELNIPIPSFLDGFFDSLFFYYRSDLNETIYCNIVVNGENIYWEVSLRKVLESCVEIVCFWVLSGCPENILSDYGSLDLYECEIGARLNVFLSYLLIKVVRSCFTYDCVDDLREYFDDPTMRGLIPSIWRSWMKNKEMRGEGDDYLERGIDYMVSELRVSFSDLDNIISEVLN